MPGRSGWVGWLTARCGIGIAESVGSGRQVGWRSRLDVEASFSRKATLLSTFTAELAASLPGEPWLQRRRTAAAEAFSSAVLPSEKDEVWRYSRIDELQLDRFRPVGGAANDPSDARAPSPSDRVRTLIESLGPRAGLVVTINGVLATVSSALAEDTLTIGRATDRPDAPPVLGSVISDPHDFVLLNDAFAMDPLFVDVAPEAVIEHPIVLVHVVSGCDGKAVFPRTVIHGGPSSVAGVVEIVVDVDTGLLAGLSPSPTPIAAVTSDRQGPDSESLVVPVTEIRVGEHASLAYVSVQSLGLDAWQLAHQASAIAAGATLKSYAVALGGGYARLRTDSALEGESGTSNLRAAFVGRNEQMLDFRTLQDHLAPRTTSDLLFKGSVADRSHSVYSGLIRIRRGAERSDAMQTNHNLVLDEGAHADSVPNLDIEENDVRCSHGSTVGPVDEDQRYYLESRGVEPDVAERLIVAGFFEDIADQVPIEGTRALIARALTRRAGASDAGAGDD